MSPPAEAEFKQPGSVRADAGMYPGRHPGREHHHGDSSVPGTGGQVQPGETRCVHMAKGPAEPALSPPLPRGLLTPSTNQTAKTSLQTDTLRCKELAKETRIPFADAASFPQPSWSPEEGEIPFDSSAERNLAATLMERDPGDPSAAGAGRVPNTQCCCCPPSSLQSSQGLGQINLRFQIKREKQFL